MLPLLFPTSPITAHLSTALANITLSYGIANVALTPSFDILLLQSLLPHLL